MRGIVLGVPLVVASMGCGRLGFGMTPRGDATTDTAAAEDSRRDGEDADLEPTCAVDDFESGSAENWSALRGPEGTVESVDDDLSYVVRATEEVWLGNDDYHDIPDTLELRIRFGLFDADASLGVRLQGKDLTQFWVGIREAASTLPSYLSGTTGGSPSILDEAESTVRENSMHELRIRKRSEGRVEVELDDSSYLAGTEPSIGAPYRLDFFFWRGGFIADVELCRRDP